MSEEDKVICSHAHLCAPDFKCEHKEPHDPKILDLRGSREVCSNVQSPCSIFSSIFVKCIPVKKEREELSGLHSSPQLMSQGMTQICGCPVTQFQSECRGWHCPWWRWVDGVMKDGKVIGLLQRRGYCGIAGEPEE